MNVFIFILLFLNICYCKRVITIGSTFDYKPYSYMKDGKHIGIDVDIINLFQDRYNFKIVYQKTSWNNLTSDLLDYKYDIGLTGISITDQRLRVANFSIGYYQDHKAIIGKCYRKYLKYNQCFNNESNIDNLKGGFDYQNEMNGKMNKINNQVHNNDKNNKIKSKMNTNDHFKISATMKTPYCVAFCNLDIQNNKFLVNPGGTNEILTKEIVKHANVTVYPSNLLIFDQLIKQDALMITERAEILLQSDIHKGILCQISNRLVKRNDIKAGFFRKGSFLVYLFNELIQDIKQNGILAEIIQRHIHDDPNACF